MRRRLAHDGGALPPPPAAKLAQYAQQGNETIMVAPITSPIAPPCWGLATFPADLVLLIMAYIPPYPRAFVLPLVCKRWHTVAIASSTRFPFATRFPCHNFTALTHIDLTAAHGQLGKPLPQSLKLVRLLHSSDAIMRLLLPLSGITALRISLLDYRSISLLALVRTSLTSLRIDAMSRNGLLRTQQQMREALLFVTFPRLVALDIRATIYEPVYGALVANHAATLTSLRVYKTVHACGPQYPRLTSLKASSPDVLTFLPYCPALNCLRATLDIGCTIQVASLLTSLEHKANPSLDVDALVGNSLTRLTRLCTNEIQLSHWPFSVCALKFTNPELPRGTNIVNNVALAFPHLTSLVLDNLMCVLPGVCVCVCAHMHASACRCLSLCCSEEPNLESLPLLRHLRKLRIVIARHGNPVSVLQQIARVERPPHIEVEVNIQGTVTEAGRQTVSGE